MPLITTLSQPCRTDQLLYNLTSHPSFQNSAANFLQNARVLNERVLYVFQRERATIGTGSGFDWIGSGDATTCTIVFLHCPKTKRASVGHFDGTEGQISGGETCSLVAMIHSFTEEERMEGLQAHLVGGFSDQEDSTSSMITNILGVFEKSEVNIRLMTFCVHSLNTQHLPEIGPAPKTRGAAMHLETGELFSVSLFQDRGPEIPLRSIHSFLGLSSLENIYDNNKNYVTFGPYFYVAWDDARFILRLSDEKILENTSSSPKVEGPNFVPDRRKL